MNDCYWGGEWQQFYYECDTGRIVGELKVLASQTYEAYYIDALNGPRLGKYIDSDRARKAVELAHKCEMEKWERMRMAWQKTTAEEPKNRFKEVLDKVCPDETPKKTWWKVWE